jgi:hypothetical protein
VFSHFKTYGLAALLCLGSVLSVSAQDNNAQQQQEKPKKEEKPNSPQQQQIDLKNATAEQVAESSILIYGGLGGRPNLEQIRRTTVENGKTLFINPDKTTEQIPYTKRIIRGENLGKERIRFDQEYPNARFALIFNNGSVFGLINESVFTPRQESVRAFQQQIWHGLEALLRYKENGSTLNLNGREKHMNVEYFVLDVIDPEKRQTRFYISTKTLRVMWLEYTDSDIKHSRRFYDYRYAQGTLVPYRTTLFAGDRLVEESRILTITFGQKLDEEIFQIG